MSQPAAAFADNLRGAGFISLSMLGFAVNDALMKLIAPQIGLFESIFARGVLASLLIGLLAWRWGALRRLPPRADAPWLALRAGAEVTATFCYLTAIMAMPLAEVSAIAQTGPLMITLAGAIFLGEQVGWRRWSAIAAGFAGVLIILRPGMAAFDPAAFYALGGVFAFTLRDVITRKLARETPSLQVTLLTALSVTCLGGFGAATEAWIPIGPWQAAGLAATALLVLVGYFFGIQAMRAGDIGFISPFRYTVLIWTMILGFAMFDERPDGFTLLGAGLIVAAGLYAFWRERQVGRAAAAEAMARAAGGR